MSSVICMPQCVVWVSTLRALAFLAAVSSALCAPHFVSPSFPFDTRDVGPNGDTVSGNFPFDSRPHDGMVGWAASGDASLDTGGSAGLPVVQGISPTAVAGSNSRQWISVLGSGFIPGAVVLLQTGTESYVIPPSRTEFVSSGEIRIFVNLTTAAAGWTARVVNPNGKISGTVAFQVNPPSVLPEVGLDFGVVAPGQSASRSFTLRNNSQASQTYSLTGVGGAFEIESLGPGLLGVDQTAQVTLRYNPTTPARDDLAITLQVGSQSLVRSLTGRCVEAMSGTGSVEGTVVGTLVGGGTEPLRKARVVVRKLVSLEDGGFQNVGPSAETDSRGAFTIGSIPPGNYLVSVFLDGPDRAIYYGHAYSGVPVTVVAGATQPVAIQLQRQPGDPTQPKNWPVVLVRGIRLPIGSEPESAYWQEMRDHLVAEDFSQVWDPNMGAVVVDGMASIESNATALRGYLKAKIADYISTNGAPPRKVHFVCHSMGGLIVRRLLHDNQAAARGERLPLEGDVFMLGTPNAGTALASSSVAAITDLFVKEWVNRKELTTHYITQEFAPLVKWPGNGVRLFLVGGDRTNGNEDLKNGAKLMAATGDASDFPNDGAVSLLSSQGKYIEGRVSSLGTMKTQLLRKPVEKSSFPDARLHPVGWQRVPLNHFEVNSDSTICEWVAGILAMPNERVTGISFAAPMAFSMAMEGSLLGEASALAMTSSSSGGGTMEAVTMSEGEEIAPHRLLDYVSDSVPAGGNATLHLPVDEVSNLVVKLVAEGSPALRLVRPDGQVIDEASAAGFAGVTFEQVSDPGGVVATCAVSGPGVGGWQVVIDAAGLAEPVAYEMTVSAASEISLVASHEIRINNGLLVPVTAALGDSTSGLMLPTSATMTAWIFLPDGTAVQRQLLDDGTQGDGEPGDGVFGLLQGDLTQPGDYEIVIKADATLPGSGIAARRAYRGVFTVAAAGGFVGGQPEWRTLDSDDNGLVDSVLVDVPVSIAMAGDYTISAMLSCETVEGDQVELRAVTEFARDDGGSAMVTLHFDPRELPEQRTFGPFVFDDINLFRRGPDGAIFLDASTAEVAVPVSLFNPAARSIRVGGDIDFGTVPVAREGERELEIFNDGWLPIEVHSIGLAQPFASAAEGVIPPGGSIKLAVYFRPTQEGQFGGLHSIQSDAQAGESAFAVSGRGGPEEIELSDWLARKGVPSGKRGPLDDAGSGMPNVLAYLFNVSPLTGNPSGDPHARPIPGLHQSTDGDLLSIRFRKNRNAVAVSFEVEESETLRSDSWMKVTPHEIIEGEFDSITGDPIIEVRVPMGIAKKKFLRLKVKSTNP
jgi:hypothetical protein